MVVVVVVADVVVSKVVTQMNSTSHWNVSGVSLDNCSGGCCCFCCCCCLQGSDPNECRLPIGMYQGCLKTVAEAVVVDDVVDVVVVAVVIDVAVVVYKAVTQMNDDFQLEYTRSLFLRPTIRLFAFYSIFLSYNCIPR